MNYLNRLAWCEAEIINRLNDFFDCDIEDCGDGFQEEICLYGLALFVKYGWTQQDLQQAWPKLFKERKL